MKSKVLILLLSAGLAVVFPQESKENADFKLAVSLFNDKLYDLAVEQFRQFVVAYPNTQQGVESRYYLGLTQRELKRFEDARFTFQNFALAFPEHPKAAEAWWNVAGAYVEMGNPREAALAFERVKTFHPKSPLAPDALLKASTYFGNAGDQESSKKALRALTQEYGSSPVVLEARLRLARIYFSEGQFEPARAEAFRVAEGSSDPLVAPAALRLAAASLKQMGRQDEAMKALAEVVTKYRTSPSYFEALHALAELNAESGSVDEARRIWKQIVGPSVSAPGPVKEAAFIAMGDVEVLQGKPEPALASFEAAAALRLGRAGEAAFKAARTAEGLRNSLKAGEWYLKAAEDSSGMADRKAIAAGAVLGSKLIKNYHLMTRFAQKFRDQYPEDPHTPLLMVETGMVVLTELNDPRHARDWFESVVRDFPQSEAADDALFGLAKALRNEGEPLAALQSLESLQKRFPASDYLREARELEFQIRTFDQKDKEGGIENLALLTGDVIAGKPKAELAFRLAEIYFNDLKSYSRAAQQYEIALQNRLTGELRAMAWYHRAQALEFLSRAEAPSRASASSVTAAIAAYDSLLRGNPEFPMREDAMIARAGLRIRSAQTISELRKISDDMRREQWSVRSREKALLMLGEAYQSLKSNADAVLVFRELSKGKPDPQTEARALFFLAQAHLELGERDSAATVLDQYLRKYPMDEFSAKASLALARYDTEKGSLTRALRLIAALKQNFSYSNASGDLRLAEGDAYYAAGDYPNALKSYVAFSNQLSETVYPFRDQPEQLIRRLADCYRRTGNRAEAKRHYGMLLTSDTSASSRSETFYILASIAREENNLDAAARYLDASRLGAVSPEQRQKTGLEELELLLRSEDYKTALARMEALLPQMKADSLRQYLEARMVVAYFRLDNLPEADKRANAFVRAHPKALEEAAEFEYERGRYHVRKEEIDFALRRLENVRSRYPRSRIVPENVYWLARAYEMKNDPQRSIQLYDSLIQKFPGHAIIPRVQLSLGNVYYSLEQWDAAAKQYKLLVDDPSRAPELVQFAMSNLIMAYKEIGLFDAAMQLTREYIGRYPSDPDLVMKRIDLGVIYQKLGYYDQSILHLQSMLENANPDLEGELRYYIGEAYFYKGEYQQAILEFLKVPYLITLRTKIDWVATSYYMAGQAYEKMSRFEQAVTMYRQIIERPGIDATFKTAAQKEIDRVNAVVKGR